MLINVHWSHKSWFSGALWQCIDSYKIWELEKLMLGIPHNSIPSWPVTYKSHSALVWRCTVCLPPSPHAYWLFLHFVPDCPRLWSPACLPSEALLRGSPASSNYLSHNHTLISNGVVTIKGVSSHCNKKPQTSIYTELELGSAQTPIPINRFRCKKQTTSW